MGASARHSGTLARFCVQSVRKGRPDALTGCLAIARVTGRRFGKRQGGPGGKGENPFAKGLPSSLRHNVRALLQLQGIQGNFGDELAHRGGDVVDGDKGHVGIPGEEQGEHARMQGEPAQFAGRGDVETEVTGFVKGIEQGQVVGGGHIHPFLPVQEDLHVDHAAVGFVQGAVEAAGLGVFHCDAAAGHVDGLGQGAGVLLFDPGHDFGPDRPEAVAAPAVKGFA